jgi:hypothetical protein
LNSSREFIEDVYESVSALGDNKTALISDGEYLRVAFEENLTNKNDITIYARAACNDFVIINGIEVPCDIYYKKLKLDALRQENG